MTKPESAPTLDQRLAARDPGNGKAVMYQSWRSLLFLHWKVDPTLVQSMLPPGLTLDLYQGEAYVGIVPFFMCDVRPRFLPCVPYLSNFLELNVRTYVHNAEGVPGVWFFSLDANCPPAVWAARTFFKLPYRHAKMSGAVDDSSWVNYMSRCDSGGYDSKFRYRGVGASSEAESESLEFFLLERYFLYVYNQGRKRILRGQVAHAPYRFRSAEVSDFGIEPMTKQGLLPLDRGEGKNWDHACVAEDVDVRIHGLERVAIE